MSRRARAVVAAIGAHVVFVVAFAAAAFFVGLDQHTGWSAAWRVGCMAITIQACAWLLALTVWSLCEWVMRGSDER